MRIPIVLTFVALALAGCNANQAINPSGQANLCASDPSCNPYNPSSYAQNNVGIGRQGPSVGAGWAETSRVWLHLFQRGADGQIGSVGRVILLAFLDHDSVSHRLVLPPNARGGSNELG